MKNNRRKVFAFLLAFSMLSLLPACGRSDEGQAAQTPEENMRADKPEDEKEDPADGGADEAGNTAAGDKILIAYFTAAENSGVDAISSASYTTIGSDAVGCVRAVADMIQAQTGGELFPIQSDTIYPADREALIDQAADEQDENFRPELTTHIENPDDYDVIFVGYPNMEQGFESVLCA